MIIEKSFFDRLKQIYLVEEFCGYTDEDIDYICFTNNHTLKSDRWQFVYIQDEENIGDMLLSRKIKI